MQNVLYVEISIVGTCLLLIILFNQHQNVGSSTLQRQFNRLVYATIAMLAVDTACWLIDGADFPYAHAANWIIETLYYFLNILIPFLWAIYVEINVSRGQKIPARRLRLLVVPLLIFSAALVVNLHTQTFFQIDEQNLYHRSAGFVVFVVLAYAYLTHATGRALLAARRAGWKEERRRLYLMVWFAALPAAGGLIQTFFYGVTLIWVFTAVAIMMMYIDSLNRQISADPLTGINNRRELTKYILRETRESTGGGTLALVMMDVDGFKQVNDSFGHPYGDAVLLAVAEILKQACKDTPAFLARFGGDEFCIVYPADTQKAVEGVIARIRNNVVQWNSARTEPVKIGLSIGYAVWNADGSDTVEDLYKRADLKMYEAKNEKKQA